MKSRSSSITILACIGTLIPGIMWMLLADPQGEGSAAAAPGRAMKSEGRRVEDVPHAAERAATMRAREALRDDPRLKAIWVEDSMENTLMRSLLRPFDPSELRRMLDDIEANEWEVTDLLMRAGAEKDPGFQGLLAKPELRANRSMDMALCVYDYSLNGNREALERIIEAYRETADATGKGQWIDPAWRALEYVDEWDLVKRALVSHPMAGGGDSDFDPPLSFWLTRRYLFPLNRDFPDDYDRFVEDLGEEQRKSDTVRTRTNE
jgi:hypothetical protein